MNISRDTTDMDKYLISDKTQGIALCILFKDTLNLGSFYFLDLVTLGVNISLNLECTVVIIYDICTHIIIISIIIINVSLNYNTLSPK